MVHYPPFLKKNATIGITCAAGFMELSTAETCIQTLKEWGYIVIVGKTVGGDSQNYFSAPDDVRLNELQSMLDDENIQCILFGRGGYGMGRIIDQLSFKKFKKNPKWLIGFSDVTLLHQHVFSNFNIATIHSPMASAFNDENAAPYISMLKDLVSGKKLKYTVASHPMNQTGKAKGVLTGGNLSMLCNATGTPSALKTKDRILFLEDVGEYTYNIDRMLYHLKRSGAFKNIKGLIFGGFTDMKDTTRPFGSSVDDVLKNIAKDLDCPVCFHFPVGHNADNAPLIVGGTYQFNVDKNGVTLSEVRGSKK